MKILVKRAQHGDAEAFIELIEKNKMTLQRVAYGYFRDEEDVADVIQDTILGAFEHIQELKKAEFFKNHGNVHSSCGTGLKHYCLCGKSGTCGKAAVYRTYF